MRATPGAGPFAPSPTLCAMEQPTQQTIYSLFNGRIQFQVPVYQRAYVWSEDKNWGLLWDDIADTADRYLDDPEAHLRHRHFLGPIVLSQQPSPPSGIDPRLVIDGQQRLTTLQIILAATAAAARDYGADGVATDLADLTANRGEEVEGNDRYKIWPSRRDREAFLATIDNGADAEATSAIASAWRYFRDQIESWITDDGDANADKQTERLRGLKTCLEQLLYVVAINLDDTDNAQVIFETLNARGTGLGALDLIKNAVFLQAQRQAAPADQLHDREWEPTFENDDYWLEETRQGREKRARADWFLMVRPGRARAHALARCWTGHQSLCPTCASGCRIPVHGPYDLAVGFLPCHYIATLKMSLYVTIAEQPLHLQRLRTIKADELEAQLIDWIRDFQPQGHLLDLLLQTLNAADTHNSQPAGERRGELLDQLQRLQDLYVLGDLTKVQYVMRRRALEEEVQRLGPPTDPGTDRARDLLERFPPLLGTGDRPSRAPQAPALAVRTSLGTRRPDRRRPAPRPLPAVLPGRTTGQRSRHRRGVVPKAGATGVQACPDTAHRMPRLAGSLRDLSSGALLVFSDSSRC